MTAVPATLHMLCGKIASGKSTLASKLQNDPGTVLISEDNWLRALFSDQMLSIADYARCSAKLRSIMGPHVAELLKAGTSVVLDFPANTVETRKWMREIVDHSEVAHQMHFLAAPDHVCLARLRVRNARGDHPFAPTEAQFHQMAEHFVPPTAEEGFTMVVHESVD